MYYLYVLYLHNAIEIDGVFKYVIKIGTTQYPEHRKWASSTYSPHPPVYLHLFQFDPQQFHHTPRNLYELDNKRFPEFLVQTRRSDVHIHMGGGTEWYIKDGWDYVAVLREFFQSEGLTVDKQIDNDPYLLRAPIEQKELEKEDDIIVSCRDAVHLKDEFFDTFLSPGAVPRRNQLELWDKMEMRCRSDGPIVCTGLVQWATGTGKTLAYLMLILLFYMHTKRNRHTYRGLLVSPRNDIFHTIIQHIRKLSKWGITICEGHDGKLSSLSIPLDEPVLITATHASLTKSIAWNMLPPITQIHYDEAHRSTGEEFHGLLLQKLKEWTTPFITGTSATPKTCVSSQHNKLGELFGNPLSILHRCDVDEAIQEGWIAPLRFGVHVLSNKLKRSVVIRSFVDIVRQSILEKQAHGKWNGGKLIVYLPSINDVHRAVSIAQQSMSEWHIYTAVNEAEDTQDMAYADDQFVSDPADGTPRILFACERYREGSDIKGMEMTVTLMGNTIAAYVLVQIAGRASRMDHVGKEGWCVIVRPSEEGTTEDDVFDAIILDIMEFIGESDISPSKDKIKRVVEQFFGPVTISGKIYQVEETIQRIQAMYARKAFERAEPKEKYEVIRALNREMHIGSKHEYLELAASHPKYIEGPRDYFKDHWISWYHFLGVDTSSFPQTKHAWTLAWKQAGIRSWAEYKDKNFLPTNPGEMYEDYTNPDNEFGCEEEIVW